MTRPRRSKATTNEAPGEADSRGRGLDEALEETFPASDPVAIGHSEHVGAPAGHESRKRRGQRKAGADDDRR